MTKPIKTFAFESLLPEFLTWDEWCLSELPAEELAIYRDEAGEEDQRIITHICYEDGVEVTRFTFDQT
jgi:hypothetical protein